MSASQASLTATVRVADLAQGTMDMIDQVTGTIYKTTLYITDEFWRDVGDHRVVSKYPMMSGGPLPVIMIVIFYVYFVRKLGPKMMKTREPYDLKWPIRVYNILMSAVNAYTFYRVSILTRMGIDYFGCKQVERSGKNPAELEFIQIGFLYFSTKIIELLDTVFFILRKKYNQASNLHVFHHGFIAVCCWMYLKTAPGGSSVLFPYLNSFVHTVMYFYYFLATYKSMQKQLWWKKYLTLTQIVQFVLSMIHFSFQGLSRCDYPPALAIIGFLFNLVFLVLFVHFYNASYVRNTAVEHKKNESNKLSQNHGVHTRSVAKLITSSPTIENNNNTMSIKAKQANESRKVK